MPHLALMCELATLLIHTHRCLMDCNISISSPWIVSVCGFSVCHPLPPPFFSYRHSAARWSLHSLPKLQSFVLLLMTPNEASSKNAGGAGSDPELKSLPQNPLIEHTDRFELLNKNKSKSNTKRNTCTCSFTTHLMKTMKKMTVIQSFVVNN